VEVEAAFSDSAEQESFRKFLFDFQPFSAPLLQKTCCLPELSPPPAPTAAAADGKVTRGRIRSEVAILEQKKKTQKKETDDTDNNNNNNNLLANRIVNDGD
jgi:hypothetical protein